MSQDPAAGISPAIVIPVAQALGELGYRLKPGMTPDAVFAEAADQLKDDALGLTLASRMPIGALGDLDYALCTSATLREGIRRLIRFYPQITRRVRPVLVEAPPRAWLFYERAEGIAYSRHWREFAIATVAARIRQVVGKELVFEATFTHRPPPSQEAYDRFFGAPVKFSQPEDRAIFPHALLEAPLRTAAAAIAELLETRMLKIEEGLGGPDPYLVSTRAAVKALLEKGQTGVEATAQYLAVSKRTLQRELQRRGTSCHQVLDETRRVWAQQLLEAGQLSVQQVSERLCFSESSAFFRAFRRWTGTSPRGRQADI